MAAKAAKKKSAKEAPPQDKPKQEAPKQDAPKKDKPKKDKPKKAAAATAPENRAHHATLSELKCSDCAVGLLRQFASESLRNQKKLDPGNQRFHLQDDEELELMRANPLTLQLVSLRRERSLSNRFDDLLVVLYDPALLAEGEKTVLEAEGLRAENLKDAQAYVDAVLAKEGLPAPKNWPLPGVDVSCPQCKHWRVLIFPITTEPGYDKHRPAVTDDQGNKLPDFDNHLLIEDGVAAIAPGIYNAHYRVGLHKGARNPPESYAALQFIAPSIPARRRYPIADFLNSAQAAHDSGTDSAFSEMFAEEDKEGQKEARAKLEKELGETMPKTTSKEKAAFTKAVDAALAARNLEFYKPRIAEQRKQQARELLLGLLNGAPAKKNRKEIKKKIAAHERFIRLEDASGTETQNFETDDNQVSQLELLDDDEAPMKVGLQLVLKPLPPPAPPTPATPPAPPPAATAPPKAEAPAPPPPRTLRLTKDDVLVTLGTAAGTNIHQSEGGERGAWRRDREVNDWSEGCQVFRSPQDFRGFLRLAMLSKRALCPSRQASCGQKLTVEDVDKGIGALMTTFLKKCPEDFAKPAILAIEKAFTPPPPPEPAAAAPPASAAPPAPDPTAVAVPPAPDPKLVAAVEKLFDEHTSDKDFVKAVRETLGKVFPSKSYDSAQNFELIKAFTREKVLAALLPDETLKKALAGSTLPPKEAKAHEKALKKTLEQALDTATEELRVKLTEVKDTWLLEQRTEQIQRRHGEFLKDGLEPCDFGVCGFKFDYMLAETTRAHMETFVSKLGDRDWNTLFPDDAPPPPPKPDKKASSKSPPSGPKKQAAPPDNKAGSSAKAHGG
jgi:hypothetical protein